MTKLPQGLGFIINGVPLTKHAGILPAAGKVGNYLWDHRGALFNVGMNALGVGLDLSSGERNLPGALGAAALGSLTGDIGVHAGPKVIDKFLGPGSKFLSKNPGSKWRRAVYRTSHAVAPFAGSMVTYLPGDYLGNKILSPFGSVPKGVQQPNTYTYMGNYY